MKVNGDADGGGKRQRISLKITRVNGRGGSKDEGELKGDDAGEDGNGQVDDEGKVEDEGVEVEAEAEAEAETAGEEVEKGRVLGMSKELRSALALVISQ